MAYLCYYNILRKSSILYTVNINRRINFFFHRLFSIQRDTHTQWWSNPSEIWEVSVKESRASLSYKKNILLLLLSKKTFQDWRVIWLILLIIPKPIKQFLFLNQSASFIHINRRKLKQHFVVFLLLYWYKYFCISVFEISVYFYFYLIKCLLYLFVPVTLWNEFPPIGTLEIFTTAMKSH
jgi:hypothetical protein